MKKAFFIFLGLVVLTGGFLYLNSKDLFELKEPAPGAGEKKQTGWKLYEDERYGFEIYYPDDYGPMEGGGGKYQVGEFFAGKGAELIAISLPEAAYPGTNYLDSFLTISADADSSEEECRRSRQEGISEEGALTEFKSDSGLSFWRGKAIGAAAGTFAESSIYHIFSGNVCYEMSLNIFEGNIGNYQEGSVRQFDKDDVFRRLDSIFETFRPRPGAAGFMRRYLESYKDAATKKNFDDIKAFLSESQLEQMEKENIPLERNFTDFDAFEILEIQKEEEVFLGQIKLFKNGKALERPQGSAMMEVRVIKEKGEYKAENWYFVQ